MAPQGTVLPGSSSDYSVADETNPQSIHITVVENLPTNDVQLLFTPALVISSGDFIRASVTGVINPPAGSYDAAAFRLLVLTTDGTVDLNPSTGFSFNFPRPPVTFTDVTSAVSSDQPVAQVYAQPTGQVGQFLFDVLHADGGFPPYIWSLQSGELPPGLTLYPSGAILGTPSEAGAFKFTARVTDLSKQTYDETLTMTIHP